MRGRCVSFSVFLFLQKGCILLLLGLTCVLGLTCGMGLSAVCARAADLAQNAHTAGEAVSMQGEERARATSPVRILLQWMPQSQFAGYIMALEKGFFAEEGLTQVELHWSQLGEMPLVRLTQGDADFATAWLLTALQRRAEGLPIVNVAQFMQSSASLLVARKDKGIRTLNDLNGKTILSWGGDFGLEFDVLLEFNNIKPARVLPLSLSLAPFLYGLVDAMQAMRYSEYLRLLERGMKADEMMVFPLAEHKVDVAGDGLYTTVDYLTRNPERVRAVRRAVIRGWAYAFAHEDETVNYVLQYGDTWKFRSNREYQLQMLRSIRIQMEYLVGPDPRNWGTLSPEAFERARSLVKLAGLPVHDESYETFFQAP